MPRNTFQLPTADSLLSGSADPLSMVHNYSPPTAPKPSKRELDAYAARLEQDQINNEAMAFVDQVRSQSWWRDGTWRRRQEAIDNYENNIWPSYAAQRFGNDTTKANLVKNLMLQPLREDVRNQKAQDTWTNTYNNLVASAQAGFDQGRASMAAAPVAFDIITGQDASESIDNLANVLIDNRLREQERIQNTPQRQYDTQRIKELEEEGKDYAFFRNMWEQRSIRPLINQVVEQWPNLLASLGFTTAGAAIGSTAGPAGAVAGGAAGAAAGGALTTVMGLVSQVSDEIFNATPEELRSSPRYKELEQQGYSEADAKSILARDAAREVIGLGAALGAASGVLGPEAIIARSSVLSPLLRGGLMRRIATGAGLGFAEEFPSEYTEQVIQNRAYNAATGEDRALTEGALESGLIGGAVGGLLGGVGGFRNREQTSTEAPTRPNAVPSPEGSVGGFNVPTATNLSIPGGVTNPVYNPDSEADARARTAAARQLSDIVDGLVNKSSPVVPDDMPALFNAMQTAQQLGLDLDTFEPLIASVQNAVNKSLGSNFNVMDAYNAFLAANQYTIQPAPAPFTQPTVAQPAATQAPVTQVPVAPAAPVTQPAVDNVPVEPAAPEPPVVDNSPGSPAPVSTNPAPVPGHIDTPATNVTDTTPVVPISNNVPVTQNAGPVMMPAAPQQTTYNPNAEDTDPDLLDAEILSLDLYDTLHDKMPTPDAIIDIYKLIDKARAKGIPVYTNPTVLNMVDRVNKFARDYIASDYDMLTDYTRWATGDDTSLRNWTAPDFAYNNYAHFISNKIFDTIEDMKIESRTTGVLDIFPVFRLLKKAQENGVDIYNNDYIKRALDEAAILFNESDQENLSHRDLLPLYNKWTQDYDTPLIDTPTTQDIDNGTGREQPTTGIENSPATSSPTATTQSGPDQGPVSNGPETPPADGTAAQGTGTGGTAYTDPGTTAGNVQANQPADGRTADGTDSGSDNTADDTTGTGSDTGNGITVGEAEQRASDGRFKSIVRQLTKVRNGYGYTAKLSEFTQSRMQYYDSMGLTPQESYREASIDATIADNMASYLLSLNINNTQITTDLRNIEERIRKEFGRSAIEARRGAVFVYRMINTIAQVRRSTVKDMLNAITFTSNTETDVNGYYSSYRSVVDNNRISTIGWAKTADLHTLIHEFTHYYFDAVADIVEEVRTGARNNSPAIDQLKADYESLLRFFKIPKKEWYSNKKWPSKYHEYFSNLIERYFMGESAPRYTGLGRAMAAIKALFKAWYDTTMDVINRLSMYANPVWFDREKMYSIANLPPKVRTAVDNIFRGYNSPVTDLLKRWHLDTTIELRNTLDAEFGTLVNYYMAQNGKDIYEAYNDAAEYMRNRIALGNFSANEKADVLTEVMAADSIDYVMNIDDAVQAEPDNFMLRVIDEAMQDPQDMTSPLVTLGSTPTYVTQNMSVGILDPAVNDAVNGDQNGPFLDSPSMIVNNHAQPDTDNRLLMDEDSEQVRTVIGNEINMELSLGDKTPVGVEYNNEDGSSDINEYAQLDEASEDTLLKVSVALDRQSQDYQDSLKKGIDYVANKRSSFANTVYSPQWIAGRWASMATKIRKNFMDGGAYFRTYCLQYLSNANTNPDQTPLLQSFQNLTNSITGAARLFMDNVYNPLMQWAEQTAGSLNVDTETFMRDMGLYRTALHTIEAAYKQREELEQALQEAYALSPGQEKIDAVAAATEALESFIERQNGHDVKVKLYGGRSIREAQAIIQDVMSKYGKDLCDEGSNRLGNGFRWINRFLMENGQLSQSDVDRFDTWLYYCPMTTDSKSETGAINDIAYYAPRQNFHRYGSYSPAQDAFSALTQYGARAARTVGMSEFGTYLRQAYLMFEKQNNVTNQIGNAKYFNGMAMIPEEIVNGIRYGTAKHTKQAEMWAQNIENNTDVVIRVREKDDNGNDVIKAYRVLFDKSDPFMAEVHEAVRNPFYASDPDVFLRRMAKATRLYASVYTRLKPYFPVITSIRDMTERISYLPTKNFINDRGESVSGSTIARQMVGFAMNPVNFIRLAKYWTTGRSGSEYIDSMMRDFQASGVDASSSYNELLRISRKKTVDDIRSIIPTSIKGKGPKTVRAVVNTLSRWSDFFYSLPAFAQFIKMRENGINMRDTVDGVTSLMNMAQRGRFTSRYLAPMFPFVNSIGQTAGNLLGALGLHVMTFGNHPQANMLRRKAVAGWCVMFMTYGAIRALIPLIQESLGEGEEGERRLDLMPLSQVSTFIPIGIGDGAYIKWPTGFGPAMLGAMAAYGFDRVERGKMSEGDLMATMFTAFAKTLIPNSMPAFEFQKNPMQFIVQSFSPMLVQPIVQVATGYSYSGAKLSYDIYDSTSRKSDRYNLTTDRTWVDLAKTLYDTVGVDMAPEEIRALANGYLGGVLQGAMALIESDPLYSNPTYQSTREQLGPFWSALGATSVYDVGMNVAQSSFFHAKDYYDAAIRRAGIGNALRGTVEEKRNILLSAGFTPAEADDYIAIYRAYNKMSQLNTDTRKHLDPLFGPNMDEDTIRRIYQEWSIQRQGIQNDTVRILNFYNPNHRLRFDTPDELASMNLRNEVPGAPVVPGNIDLYNRPVVKNADGTISTVQTMTDQDVDGMWVNYPSIGPNGERWTREQAWQYYLATGQHLGKYRTLDEAVQAAIALHEDQADLYVN